MENGGATLETLLDRVEELRAAGDLEPVREDLGRNDDETAGNVAILLNDRQLRPEHRERIYRDLLDQRENLLALRDPRLVDLIFWSEHVGTLHAALRRGELETFHYTRALEATCRRCGFELLPVLGRMEELGKAWGGGHYDETYSMLSPDVVQVDPPGEAAPELGS